MMRFLGDRRASVVTVFAFSACVFAVMTATVVDQVTFYVGKRKLQAATDLAALMVMRSGTITSSRAKDIVASQISDATGLTVSIVQGRYTPDQGKTAATRFLAGATPYNAVQVDAVVPATGAMLAGMLPGGRNLRSTARAARRQTASLVVGSRLIRVEGGLSQAFLNAVLGYSGKVTVMDYNALAAANIDAVKFLNCLNTKANIKAATFQDVLDANVTVGQVISALAATTDSPVVAATLGKAVPAYPGKQINLSDIVDVGSLSTLPLDALTNGDTMPINVGEVLAGSAALSNDDHQAALDLAATLGDASIANVSLDIGEKPQLLRYDAFSSPGTTVDTSQVKLTVGALGKFPATVLKVDINLASAAVQLVSINCQSDGKAGVTLKATTKAASVSVKAPILPAINVALGSDEAKTLTFTPSEIAAQTWKPTRSGLGLQVGSLSIAQKLLMTPVDNLLTQLGLNVAEADVKVVDADCGGAGLVY